MPVTNRTPTNRNRLRLRTMDDVKRWVKEQIELYKEDELERAASASSKIEEGQYVDGATLFAVAAKKKIVRQKLTKLLNAMAA